MTRIDIDPRKRGSSSIYNQEKIHEINPSKRIHSVFRPLIIAYHGISNVLTGENGVRDDFRKLYDLYLTYIMEEGLKGTINGETYEQIDSRLHTKLGDGAIYKLARSIYYYQ
jgi:hypothetical protein